MGPLLTLKRFSRALIVYTFYYPLFIVYCSLSAVRGYDTARNVSLTFDCMPYNLIFIAV